MMNEFVSREELYEMVWATPTQRLSREFGMSDVALGKICKKLSVPKPPPGYWARKASGQPVTRTPLPRKNINQRPGVFLARKAKQRPPEPELSNSTLDLIASLEMPENAVAVSDTLLRANPLVRRTKRALTGAQSDIYGALWPRNECLDLRVSKRSLRRALLLMDALLKRLTRLGYEITISECGETVVGKNGVQMKLGLYERFRRFEQVLTDEQKLNSWRYDRFRFEPSDEFDLRLTRWPLGERHWKDTAKRKVEDRLTDIVIAIILSTELVQIENEKRGAAELLRLEQERLDAERHEQEIEENRRLEELENQASSWQRANKLRAFLQACEAEFSDLSNSDLNGKAAPWLRWGYEHADRLDPLKNHLVVEVFSRSAT